MKRIDLFSTPVWTTSIDPTSYNKQEIIDTISSSYEKQPNRNNHTSLYSNMHNYYMDWENPDFAVPDFTQLNVIYNNLINQFLNTQVFIKPVTYNYRIVNISASKKGQWFEPHHHCGANVDFATVHYISLDNSHMSTIFENPTAYSTYTENQKMEDFINSFLFENTVHAKKCTIGSREDDFVIFPSYLKHQVLNESDSDKLRITISCNITLEDPK